jgi:hypothetical protein
VRVTRNGRNKFLTTLDPRHKVLTCLTSSIGRHTTVDSGDGSASIRPFISDEMRQPCRELGPAVSERFAIESL